MKLTILLSIIVLLLINEISFTYLQDRELFKNGVDDILAKELANIPSKRDKYGIQFKIYLKDFGRLTNDVKHKDKERNMRFKTIKIQRNLINNYDNEIKKTKRNQQTNKRITEIESRENNEIEYKTNLAIKSLIYVVCLTLILLLYKANIISKMASIIFYVIGLFLLICYLFYMLLVKQSNVDDHYYKQYNFIKPSEEEILLSRLRYEKNKKEGEMSVDEIYKNNNIPANSIDVSEYINEVNDERNNQTCSA